MDARIDSDFTMIAVNSFNAIVSQVQNSGLNYQLQMSPFSAFISLKKSLVRDMSGCPILPAAVIQNCNKTETVSSLMKKLSAAYEEIEELKQTIKARDGAIVDLEN